MIFQICTSFDARIGINESIQNLDFTVTSRSTWHRPTATALYLSEGCLQRTPIDDPEHADGLFFFFFFFATTEKNKTACVFEAILNRMQQNCKGAVCTIKRLEQDHRDFQLGELLIFWRAAFTILKNLSHHETQCLILALFLFSSLLISGCRHC